MSKLTREQLDAWADAVSARIEGMLEKRRAERAMGLERDPAVKAARQRGRPRVTAAPPGMSKREAERRARMGKAT